MVPDVVFCTDYNIRKVLLNRSRLVYFGAGLLIFSAISIVVFKKTFTPTSTQPSTPASAQDTPVIYIRDAKLLMLHEGLPHPFDEEALLNKEKSKPYEDLHGYAFYSELLSLTDDDTKRVSEMLGNPATYKQFRGEKKCGGFHPDYAVEWTTNGFCYMIFLCFGCGEAKVFASGTEYRFDLDGGAAATLKEILKKYRKNRPKIRTACSAERWIKTRSLPVSK